MDGKLLCEVIQGIKAVTRVKAFLVLLVAALYFAVVSRRIGQMSLYRIPNSAAVVSKSMGRSHLLLEKRLVNSKLLSIWTHSAWIPRRAYHLNNFFRKSTKE